MRIDKFLKVSRLIKRRSVANEACGSDRIEVNGKSAKPSKDVNPGDIITMRFGSKTLSVEVLSIKEHTLKNDAAEMYRVIEEREAD